MRSVRPSKTGRGGSRVAPPASRSGPLVSVIVPVYNVEPYLRECLDSILNQSIGQERLELIAVDDGSTDGSAALLDDYAERHQVVRVFHEPNSGGPGRPRNVGLDHAAGTYVHFVDADDYLGPEALERLVAMAERNDSDVVIGKMVAINGRLLPTRAFRRTRDRADITDVYSLNVLKLFRRALLEQLQVRFDEAVAGGEDGPFTAKVLLSAHVISVVADYNCYYCRDRPGSQTKRKRTEDPAEYLMRMAERASLLAEHRPPGRERDRLMVRHIGDMLRPFNKRWLALPLDDRRRMFDAGRKLFEEWHNDRIQQRLSPHGALRAYCLQHGHLQAMEDIVATSKKAAAQDYIVEGDRVYANFPHFRDEYNIPDSCFELTRLMTLSSRIDRAAVDDGKLLISGEAYLSYIGGETTVVLKRWPWGEQHRYATKSRPTPTLRDRYGRYPQAGFVAKVDLATAREGAPLPPGPWKITLSVGPPSLQREAIARVGRRRARTLPAVLGMPRISAGRAILYKAPDGSLRLRTGGEGQLRTILELAAAHVGRHAGPGLRRLRRTVRGLRRRLPQRQLPPESDATNLVKAA